VRVTIARNTTFNALGRFFEGIIGLVLTPYILTHLDLEVWGLWSLVAVFTGYAALLDFGVASGFVKYLAQHTAKEDKSAFSAVVSTGFFFYAAFGVVVVAVGWAAIDIILDGVVPLFRPIAAEDEALMAEMRFLFRGALVLFAVNNCLAPFAAVPTGMQRMGISNVCGAGATVMKVVATVSFLEAGFGVRGLLYANATVLVVLAVATVAIAFVLQPGLRVGPKHVRRETFRDLFGFGWKTQVAKLSNLINFQTDRVVVAWYGGLGAAGVYRLGEELALKIRQMPALLVSALIPAVSDLQARDREAQLQELYLRSTKYLAVVSAPMALFLLGAAGMAMRAWLGEREGLDTAAWVLRILVVGHLVNLIPGGGMSVALGMGRPGMAMKAGLISMGSNLVLTISLVLAVGFYGVPMATTLALFISTAWFFAAMRAVLDVPLRRLAREALLWPILACLPGLLATLAIEAWAQGYTGRLPNLLAGGGAGACFGISYLVLLRYLPFLDRFDVDFLDKTLGLGRIPGFGLAVRRARD
jgi:O-antigen/teichoic acid export membrane protein